MLPGIVQIKPLRNRPEQTSACIADSPHKTFTTSSGAMPHMLPRTVQIKPSRHRPELTSTCNPDRPDKAFTKPPKANLHQPPRIVRINLLQNRLKLHMPPRVVQIKPSRSRTEHTSTCHPASSRYNLHETARSEPPEATPHRPDKLFTESS